MDVPWHSVPPLDPAAFAEVRRHAIFECCKWDPQVEDVATLAPFPLVLDAGAWRTLAGWAEALARESVEAEQELLARPELHRFLGLPWSVRRALRLVAKRGRPCEAARVMRSDFHFTTAGWRISEANTDVPGGYNEASGFMREMARHYPPLSCGDPATALVHALGRRIGPGARIALAHATAYSDDRQVMVYLGRELERSGFHPLLVSPDHLRWCHGAASIESAWFHGSVDCVFRFFPAEWLPSLPRRSGWAWFFAGAATPLCNPATALLTQSKRWPLIWDRLATTVPTWRLLLPETRDPREARWQGSDDWVLKPALGRVGDGVGLAGVTESSVWTTLVRQVRRAPGGWVAQRRFQPVPLLTPDGPWFPCVGVYTVDGRAAGAYGRLARRPLIDYRAMDAAVLVALPSAGVAATARVPLSSYEPSGAF